MYQNRYYAFLLALILPAYAVGAEAKLLGYKKDISPIIEKKCMSCHKKGGVGEQASGLSMESYSDLMQGTKFGPVIVPGKSVSSTIMYLVKPNEFVHKSIRMPKKGVPMTAEEVSMISRWIDQGAHE